MFYIAIELGLWDENEQDDCRRKNVVRRFASSNSSKADVGISPVIPIECIYLILENNLLVIVNKRGDRCSARVTSAPK